LETEETDVGPDLVADTVDITEEHETEEKEENQSASLSNTSEIEMINPDPESQENSSEEVNKGDNVEGQDDDFGTSGIVAVSTPPGGSLKTVVKTQP